MEDLIGIIKDSFEIMGLEFLVLVVINTGDARPFLDNKKTPGLPGAML
ncbi:hypothetical protein [Enterococcus timonensis]|nr:hypothetical protein [Enterococcus timonensis]